MSRPLGVAFLFLVTGCDGRETVAGWGGEGSPEVSDGPLAHRSRVFFGDSGGVRLDYTGDDSVVGVGENTCVFFTPNGVMTFDGDVANGMDEVHDVGTDEGGGDIVLVASPAGRVTVADGNTGVAQHRSDVAGHIASRFTDAGVVSIGFDGECFADYWLDGVRVALPAAACDETALDVDLAGDVAWVAGGGTITAVTTAGAGTWFSAASGHVAWDGGAGVVYAADRGSTRLEAWNPDGTLLWAADVGAPISGLDAVGSRGRVLVSAGTDAATSDAVLFDGDSGEEIARQWMRVPAGGVTTSGNGLVAAVHGNISIDFFTVEP